jgi:hypothetical protein
MLHHGRQLDGKGLRKFTDRRAVLALELHEDRAARRVDEGSEGAVEAPLIVHHFGKYWRSRAALSIGGRIGYLEIAYGADEGVHTAITVVRRESAQHPLQVFQHEQQRSLRGDRLQGFTELA